MSEAFPDIQPTHTNTNACILRQERRGGEDKQAKEDGGQGTHTDKPDNRQETLESSRSYFLSSFMLSVSILDKTGREKNTVMKQKKDSRE